MLSTARIGSDLWRPILATLLIALAAAACMGGAASGPGLGAAPAATAAAAPQAPNPDPGEVDGEDPGVVDAVVLENLLIIKTGSLVLQVTGLDAAISAADQEIATLGGYTSGSDRSGDGDDVVASITYRIPAARWEEALTALRSVGEKVLAERSSTDDVTTQVVDLGARIRNLQATEAALQAIMDRAVEIDDVLKVQAELTAVRSQVEQLTAQKTNLEGQAAYSTLSVTFSLRQDPVIASQEQFDAGTEVQEASASLVGILQALATAGIWFGIVWLPILLTLALFGAIGVVVYRRARRSGGATPMAAPEAGA